MPTRLVNQTSKQPTNKVAASSAAAALFAILSWADDRFFDDYIPGYVEAALITLGTFVAGYVVKNKATDAPPAPGVPEPNDRGYGAMDVLVVVAVVLLIVFLVLFLAGRV